jgi:hypothetical protein
LYDTTRFDSEAARIVGRLGAKLGGYARADALSPKRKSEIAKVAATARWDKYKKEQAQQALAGKQNYRLSMV